MQEPSENSEQTPAKPIRLKRDTITKREIKDANERHKRIVLKASEVVREVIELGEILNGFKRRIAHGKWTPFIENNFHFTDRTARRYMRAADTKHELLAVGPAEFMARIWGNEPKQLTEGQEDKKGKSDVDVRFDEGDENEGDEEDDDFRQHGGPGLNLFRDKGKAALFGYKTVVATLDTEFFDSDDYTLQAKLDFITELISWLENKKLNLHSSDEEMHSERED